VTAYAVIVRERTLDGNALSLYREKAPLARENHPATPVAFYGPHEVIEGSPVEGVAILSFHGSCTCLVLQSGVPGRAAPPRAGKHFQRHSGHRNRRAGLPRRIASFSAPRSHGCTVKEPSK